MNMVAKQNLILKYGQKFASRKQSHPVLRGIHYAEGGNIYVTNAFYALRIQNAHEYSEPFTTDAWTGEAIHDTFPNIENVFPTDFHNTIEIRSEQIQNTVRRIKWAHDITKSLKIENRLVSLISKNEEIYLKLKTSDVYLKSKIPHTTAAIIDDLEIGLNAEYLYNTFKLFEDAGTHSLKIKPGQEVTSPITFEDEDNGITVIILPVIKQR